MEQANRAQAVAHTALTVIGTSPNARILSATQTGTTLIVATEQPDGYFPYAVDVFRLPTEDETDPDQVDPLTPGQWLLIDQYGDHSANDVSRMVENAREFLRSTGLIPARIDLAA